MIFGSMSQYIFNLFILFGLLENNYGLNVYESNPNRNNIYGHALTWLADSVVPPVYRSAHFKPPVVSKNEHGNSTNLGPHTNETNITTIIPAPIYRSAHFKLTNVTSKIQTEVTPPRYRSAHFRPQLKPPGNKTNETLFNQTNTTGIDNHLNQTQTITLPGNITKYEFNRPAGNLKEVELFEQKEYLGRVSTDITILDMLLNGQKDIAEFDNSSSILNQSFVQPAGPPIRQNVPLKGKETVNIRDILRQEGTGETGQTEEPGRNGTETGERPKCAAFELLEGIAEFGKGLLKFVSLGLGEE